MDAPSSDTRGLTSTPYLLCDVEPRGDRRGDGVADAHVVLREYARSGEREVDVGELARSDSDPARWPSAEHPGVPAGDTRQRRLAEPDEPAALVRAHRRTADPGRSVASEPRIATTRPPDVTQRPTTPLSARRVSSASTNGAPSGATPYHSVPPCRFSALDADGGKHRRARGRCRRTRGAARRRGRTRARHSTRRRPDRCGRCP